MAKILSINISDKKGVQKHPVDQAELLKDKGIKGDAHSATGIRQVSLLAQEDIDEFAAGKIRLSPGAFAENLTTEGIDLSSLSLGTRLKIGECLLEVSKIGKECHAQCNIGKIMGRCVMPEKGIFARVLKPGIICKSDRIELI